MFLIKFNRRSRRIQFEAEIFEPLTAVLWKY
jgi:hypothetical protein